MLSFRFAELIRKIWNRKNFKSHVSPHEVIQAISISSNKRFAIGKTQDPILLFSFLMNSLSNGLKDYYSLIKSQNNTVAKRPSKTIIEDCFQGEIEVSVLKPKETQQKPNISKYRREIDTQYTMTEEHKKFYFLSLDVPEVPLFKNESEELEIPQIPLQMLLKKFDGKTFVEEKGTTIRKRIKLTKLPKYLVFHIKRFSKNQFFKEKNQTIINIPLNLLDMSPYIGDGEVDLDKPNLYRYRLISNVKHNGDANQGHYTVQVRYINKEESDTWYELQDLLIKEVMPEQVAISETYMLVYEQMPPSSTDIEYQYEPRLGMLHFLLITYRGSEEIN